MDWKDLTTYFGEEIPDFLQYLFSGSEYPWTPLNQLHDGIERHFRQITDQGTIKAKRTEISAPHQPISETAYFIEESTILANDFIDRQARIFIGAGTFVEAGATIKNHTVVERNCEIRQGAYIRGNVYIGSGSVVGHTTEIKNSIFIHHVEAGHFAYIGDSIIGSFVNLGAGTKISNLEFRSFEAKKRIQFPEITFGTGRDRLKTGLSKMGAIIGDGVETGCNSVLCPFVLLGPKCWVMPNICVYKGYYAKGTLIRADRKRTPQTP